MEWKGTGIERLRLYDSQQDRPRTTGTHLREGGTQASAAPHATDAQSSSTAIGEISSF